MTPEILVGIVGAAVALAFAYFPNLRVKFAGQPSETKSLTMIGLMILTGLAVWATSCAGWNWFEGLPACSKEGIPDMLKLIGLALITNQSINRIAPETQDVKQAKAMR